MKNFYVFFKRIVLFFRPFWKWYILVWILLILANVFFMSYPLAFGKIIDALSRADYASAKIWVYFFLVGSFFAVLFLLLRWIVDIQRLDYRITRFIRQVTLNKTKELSIGQHQNQNSGLRQSVIQKGADGSSRLAEMIVNQLSYMFLQTLVAVAVLYFYDLKLAIALNLYVLAFISVVFLINKNKEKLDKVTDLEHASYMAFTEYLRNIVMLLLNANADRGILTWQKKYNEMEELGKEYWQSYMIKHSFLLLSNRIFMAVVLLYSIFQNQAGVLSPGQIVTFLIWCNMAINSLQNLGDYQRQLVRNNIDIKKFFAFLDVEPAIKKPERATKEGFTGEIEFRDICFTYPSENYLADFEDNVKKKEIKPPHQVLKGMNFKIKPREKIAIVGLSGEGKSTLLSLLMRAYLPDSGKIFLDGIDYDQIDPDMFRKQVGMVEQNIQLLDDTLRENLLVGLNGRADLVSDEELWEVMRLANITKFQDRLTEGLDTKIGEGGLKLSGGERQRVAIARALIKKPPIIIFDEATSNLDGITEAELREAIANANKNRTSISIAHRLATVINSDRIFVISEGKVIAIGNHTELKMNCQVYRELIKTQTAVF